MTHPGLGSERTQIGTPHHPNDFSLPSTGASFRRVCQVPSLVLFLHILISLPTFNRHLNRHSYRVWVICPDLQRMTPHLIIKDLFYMGMSHWSFTFICSRFLTKVDNGHPSTPEWRSSVRAALSLVCVLQLQMHACTAHPEDLHLHTHYSPFCTSEINEDEEKNFALDNTAFQPNN